MYRLCGSSESCCQQLPLGDKPAEGRDSRKGKRAQSVGRESRGHPPADPVQFINIGSAGLVHKGACAHEQADLDDAVEYHMGQSCFKPLRRQCHDPQQHIRQVAHRGVSEPSLEMTLSQCLNGAEEKGKDRQCQADRLRRCPPQIVRPEDIIGHPHDGKNA